MNTPNLIDRQEPLLQKALNKIQDIKSIRAILQTVDPEYVTKIVEQLSNEYMAIMRELSCSTGEVMASDWNNTNKSK